MNDLISYIKNSLRDYAFKLQRRPIFLLAKSGKLTYQQVGAYLATLHSMISFTPAMLTLASAEAKLRGKYELATWFLDKLEEEKDHHKWSENDIKNLSKIHNIAILESVKSCAELIDYLQSSIRISPVSYIGYIIFAEGITALLGNSWSSVLQECCDIPANALTVVDNHVDADKRHIEENYSALVNLTSCKDMETIKQIFNYSTIIFDRMVLEIELLHSTLV